MKLVSKQETNDFDDTNIKQLSNYTHDVRTTQRWLIPKCRSQSSYIILGLFDKNGCSRITQVLFSNNSFTFETLFQFMSKKYIFICNKKCLYTNG